MNKRTLIPILWVVALASIVYAIYRSTEHRIVLTGETQQTIYGEPQHGLLLGLMIFAGLCVLSTIPLLLDKNNHTEKRADFDRRRETIREDDTVITRRKL
ncbi:MAG TPA: hypothetical protein VEX63_03545 [Flavisolibacter sp.]|jgi:hypothetical protein|nr:hypothetical protein [Flavisolibacter sp.]HZI00195.1 hypothetical protein [Flavisolibacter sp.]